MLLVISSDTLRLGLVGCRQRKGTYKDGHDPRDFVSSETRGRDKLKQ